MAQAESTAARSALPTVAPTGFVPRRWLRNAHVMTMFAWACRRRFPDLGEPEARRIRVSPDTEVLAHIHWQSDRRAHPTLVVLHGLEGSSGTHYMRGIADKAWRRGWNVVRLNQRNCGGTEHLTPGLYHSGLTADPMAVIRSLVERDRVGDVGIIGYSLGGNLAMRIAGELRDHPDLPVRAVVAVCPTIDLARCVRAIERPANFVYHYNFVRSLKSRMRRKAAAWPGAFDLSPLGRIRTIRKFDDIYTAPYHGFGTASTYYERASALAVAHRIRIPALVLAAADDPFVPPGQFAETAVSENPHIQVSLSRHGGHCAFVGNPTETHDGFWAESTALEFLSALMPASRPPGPRDAI